MSDGGICAECSTSLEAWEGDSASRPPCPNCGATVNAFVRGASEQLGLSGSLAYVVRSPNEAKARRRRLEDALTAVEEAVSTNTISKAQDALKQALEAIHELNDGLQKQPSEWSQSEWEEDEIGLFRAHVGARNAAHHESDVVAALYSAGASDEHLRWELSAAAIASLRSEAQQREYNARLAGKAVLPPLRVLVSLVASSVV
jgi:phage-related tail protein